MYCLQSLGNSGISEIDPKPILRSNEKLTNENTSNVRPNKNVSFGARQKNKKSNTTSFTYADAVRGQG